MHELVIPSSKWTIQGPQPQIITEVKNLMQLGGPGVYRFGPNKRKAC